MKLESRTYNSIINFIYGCGTQIVISLLTFISRLVFIRVLGMEYQGINGLFTSILTMLSLAELGFGNIVVFSLYKPLVEDDTSKIVALVRFYRKVYYVIAAAVAVMGLAIIPFLDYIVKLEQPVEHLVLYYILFLANSVVSYLYVYKTTLIRADQKQYIISRYTMLTQIAMTGIQIVILLIFNNYIVYLCVQILCTFTTNYVLSLKADKLYPYISLSNKGGTLDVWEKKKIFKDVGAMFSYRVGGVLLNSTDNMFISAMVSTLDVGVYSNYLLIISFVNRFINVIYEALYSSVGNLNASGDSKQQIKIFNVLVLMFSWIGSFCFVCLFILMNPFLGIFFGEDILFSNTMVFIICVNFYLPIILYPVWMYRNTTGLFQETKNVLLYAAGLNLILSYIGGKLYGIVGIVAATSIARLSTSFWFEPYVLYKKGFHKKVRAYFLEELKYSICIFGSIFLISRCSILINIEGLGGFIVKTILCLVIPNAILFSVSYKRDEFKYLINIFLKRKGSL